MGVRDLGYFQIDDSESEMMNSEDDSLRNGRLANG